MGSSPHEGNGRMAQGPFLSNDLGRGVPPTNGTGHSMAMNLNGPLQNGCGQIMTNPHAKDVHQTAPNQNSQDDIMSHMKTCQPITRPKATLGRPASKKPSGLQRTARTNHVQR